MPTPKGFANINVTSDARDALRSLAFALTGKAGQRVTLSDALRAACIVANDHQDAAVAALKPQEG